MFDTTLSLLNLPDLETIPYLIAALADESYSFKANGNFSCAVMLGNYSVATIYPNGDLIPVTYSAFIHAFSESYALTEDEVNDAYNTLRTLSNETLTIVNSLSLAN